jgi:hypothetical protein
MFGAFGTRWTTTNLLAAIINTQKARGKNNEQAINTHMEIGLKQYRKLLAKGLSGSEVFELLQKASDEDEQVYFAGLEAFAKGWNRGNEQVVPVSELLGEYMRSWEEGLAVAKGRYR